MSLKESTLAAAGKQQNLGVPLQSVASLGLPALTHNFAQFARPMPKIATIAEPAGRLFMEEAARFCP